MSDLIPGTSFVNGQTVTANDLNEIVGSASLNTKVVSSSHLKDDLFTSMDELSASDLKTEDLLIVWSPSQEKFLKIRKEEFTSDNDQATSLSNNGLGITTQGSIQQKKDIVNLFGTEEDVNGNPNALNALSLRVTGDKVMLIAPMVGSGMTLEVQGDIKASGYKNLDGSDLTTGSGGSSTSAFSLSGTTLTMTSAGAGTATFTVSGTTLTITT